MMHTQTSSPLADRARKLVESLGGTWRGTKGMCCCPAHADRTPSLSVTLGRQAILFHCFAGCTNEAVLAAVAGRATGLRELFDGSSALADSRAPKESLNANAVRLWRSACALGGTAAERYLTRRGIDERSRDLRYLGRTPLGPRDNVQFRAAMLAAVRSDEGVIAIHRTFLDPRSGKIAQITMPKRALGSLQRGAVRLAMPRGGRLGLAEGIETALAATQLFGIPCWATLGNERFGQVAIPDSIRELHLFVDNDPGGRVAEMKARIAHDRKDRTIIACEPDRRGTDWADVLQERVTSSS
jgi:putative DNA primase/helicase